MQKNRPVAESIIYLSARLEAIANKYVFIPMGISSISMKILRLLELKKELTPSQILKELGGTKSNISQRLNFLQREHLIERQYANSTDKRIVTIKLTKQGKEKYTKVQRELNKAHICLENHFNKKEIAQSQAFIKKINYLLDTSEHKLKTVFKK